METQPATVAVTLTQAELASSLAISAPDLAPLPAVTRKPIEPTDLLLTLNWRPLDELGHEGRSVWLLLEGGEIVEGWLSRKFLGTRTFWTWEPKHCRVSQFISGVNPRVLCGCVAPIAWAPKDPEPQRRQMTIEEQIAA